MYMYMYICTVLREKFEKIKVFDQGNDTHMYMYMYIHM